MSDDKATSRRIYPDLDGAFQGSHAEDETALVLDEATRVGLLKLIGKQSRDSLLSYGLTREEAEAVEGTCVLFG